MPGRHCRPRSFRIRLATSLVATASLIAGATVVVGVAASQGDAVARTRKEVVRSAAAYARSKGYHVGVSVYDTKLGHLVSGGEHTKTFASESVIKVFIAARLAHQGRLHGKTAKRAYKMITQSDDAIANSFYGSVGGDGLLRWAEKTYKVNIGGGVIRSGWWGSFRITSDGLVRAYARIKKDKRVSTWLRNAMRHHTKYGSDGFYQGFGLPQAAAGSAAVKQGWGRDYSYRHPNASQNSTGFVNNDRYAVAILVRGPASSYGSRIGKIITTVAKTILPGGHYPDAYPVVSKLSTRTVSTTGGKTLTVYGSNFTHVTKVVVAGSRAKFHRYSSTKLTLVTPRASAGRHALRVFTNHGTSVSTSIAYRSPAVKRTSKAGTPQRRTPSVTTAPPASTAPTRPTLPTQPPRPSLPNLGPSSPGATTSPTPSG